MYKNLIFITLGIVLSSSFLPLAAQDIKNVGTVECGTIIEGEFRENFVDDVYKIDIEPGTQLLLSATPLGINLTLRLDVFDPAGNLVAVSNGGFNTYRGAETEESPVIDSGILGARGEYSLHVANYTLNGSLSPRAGGIGVYTLFIGCKLRSGEMIEPNPILPEVTVSPSVPTIPSFGFPGVSSRDFGAGIEIPLALGQPQIVPLASDVALYTYSASAGENATLRVSRLSGDISIGVAVINKDTNEIIFLAGMPSSNNLAVELTFPSDATFAIGLFRLDTTERSGTSGAVQINLE